MADEPLTGEILDEQTELTLSELCRVCALETRQVVEFVEEGILRPSGRDPSRWRFASVSIEYVRRTRRLQDDLGVNLAGAALAMDLLNEIERLRSRLEVLQRLGACRT